MLYWISLLATEDEKFLTNLYKLVMAISEMVISETPDSKRWNLKYLPLFFRRRFIITEVVGKCQNVTNLC